MQLTTFMEMFVNRFPEFGKNIKKAEPGKGDRQRKCMGVSSLVKFSILCIA